MTKKMELKNIVTTSALEIIAMLTITGIALSMPPQLYVQIATRAESNPSQNTSHTNQFITGDKVMTIASTSIVPITLRTIQSGIVDVVFAAYNNIFHIFYTDKLIQGKYSNTFLDNLKPNQTTHEASLYGEWTR